MRKKVVSANMKKKSEKTPVKKAYKPARMEIEYFETEDIITSSGINGKGRMGGGEETPLDRLPKDGTDWRDLPNTSRLPGFPELPDRFRLL